MAEAEATANAAAAAEPKIDEGSAEQVNATEPAAQTDAESQDNAETKAADDKAKILKTKGKIDYDNYRNNNKFDPSKRKVSDDPEAIRKQVEFYFGDWNLPQDKFMWESSGGAENKPVPIKTIHSFKRMRTFQPYSAVVASLRESGFLEIAGEEGEETITRKVPYKPMPTGKAKAEAATVYVKGFGDETPDTQFDLESFFTQFGEVKGLKLRRTPENFFKGSVFITFADEETAKKFVALDPAPKWKDHDLKIMSKHDYCEEKNDLIRQGKLEPSRTAPKKFYEGRDGNDKGASRGNFDRNDWKKRRDHDQKHGFRDRRGGGRGRGGRGGRGGRENGGHRNGRNDEEPSDPSAAANFKSEDAPAKKEEAAVKSEDATTNNKRAREDGTSADEPAAKKVDTKAGVDAAES